MVFLQSPWRTSGTLPVRCPGLPLLPELSQGYLPLFAMSGSDVEVFDSIVAIGPSSSRFVAAPDYLFSGSCLHSPLCHVHPASR
ncbi:FHA domain-containing protein [Sesbania bispinosa]|nr:FHA domain-containing protein [Sesbania bispinosa]